MIRALAALLLLPGLAAAPAFAQSTRDVREAERVAAEQRRLAEAAAAEARRRAEEEVRAADRLVEAARAAQSAEEELLSARARAGAARRLGEQAAAAMRQRVEQLRPVLPVMLRLGLWPAETVLAVPADPEEALRGALVLRGLVRQLEGEAASLRAARQEAEAALAEARREEAALAEAEQAARTAAASVEAELLAARQLRTDAEAAEEAAADRAQAAAAQARDLAEAVQRLERERARQAARERADSAARAAAQARQDAEAARDRRLAAEAERRREAPPAGPPREAALPAPPAAGGRALPVAGRIVTGWGERVAGGPHRGVTFAAAGHARVVSPCAGRAVFAAPFRSYGLLLIVDCGGGYHFVLAGLDRLDTAAGRRLLAGEPVGLLGGGAGNDGATLYVELRRNGQPVDPRPWFAARG
jgi:septal ring factor EnvC (AmiA/AmiB activator)